jgi:hypothetical protein
LPASGLEIERLNFVVVNVLRRISGCLRPESDRKKKACGKTRRRENREAAEIYGRIGSRHR